MDTVNKFQYNAQTGHVEVDGKRVGCVKKDGYRYVTIGGKQVLEYRVVWRI